MPPASANMEDEILLEGRPNGTTETRMSTRGTREHYIGTPDRPRKDKRRGDPDDMDEDVNKTRRFNSETSLIPGSVHDQPDTKLRKLDDDMLDSRTEIDCTILAAAILGVDITDVDSPERVATVAAKYGLRAGSSFDLTSGWDFNIA